MVQTEISGGDDVEGELRFTAEDVPAGEWVRLEIPLSEFVDAGLTNSGAISQMIFSSRDADGEASQDTVYVANAFLSVDEATPMDSGEGGEGFLGEGFLGEGEGGEGVLGGEGLLEGGEGLLGEGEGGEGLLGEGEGGEGLLGEGEGGEGTSGEGDSSVTYYETTYFDLSGTWIGDSYVQEYGSGFTHNYQIEIDGELQRVEHSYSESELDGIHEEYIRYSVESGAMLGGYRIDGPVTITLGPDWEEIDRDVDTTAFDPATTLSSADDPDSLLDDFVTAYFGDMTLLQEVDYDDDYGHFITYYDDTGVEVATSFKMSMGGDSYEQRINKATHGDAAGGEVLLYEARVSDHETFESYTIENSDGTVTETSLGAQTMHSSGGEIGEGGSTIRFSLHSFLKCLTL